jgi:hypothetical protein
METRRFFLLLIFIMSATFSLAQEEQKNSIAVTIGLFRGTPREIHYDLPYYFAGKNSFEIRMCYNRTLSRYLGVSTGIGFQINNMFLRDQNLNFGPPAFEEKTSVALIHIPVLLKTNLSRRIFLTAGMLIDIDVTNESDIADQTGIGLEAALGGDIPVSNHASLQIQAFFNIHGVVSFNASEAPATVDRFGLYEWPKDQLMQIGIRVGALKPIFQK